MRDNYQNIQDNYQNLQNAPLAQNRGNFLNCNGNSNNNNLKNNKSNLNKNINQATSRRAVEKVKSMTLFSLLILFLSLCTVAISLTYGLLHSSKMAVGSITFTFDSPALEFDSGAKFYYNAGTVTYGSTDGSVALVLPTYNMSLDPNNQKASYYIKVEYVFSGITSGVTFKNNSYTYDTATMSSMTLVTGDDYRFASVSSGEVATGKTFDIFSYLSDLVFYGEIARSVIDLSIIVSADTNVNFTNVHKSQTTIKTQIGINTSLQLDVSDTIKNTIIRICSDGANLYSDANTTATITSGQITTGISAYYKVQFSVQIQIADSDATNINYGDCYYSIVYANGTSTITITTQIASTVFDLQTILSNLVDAFASANLSTVKNSELNNVQPIIQYSCVPLDNVNDFYCPIVTTGWSWLFDYSTVVELRLDVLDAVKNTEINIDYFEMSFIYQAEWSVTSGTISTGISAYYKIEFSVPFQVETNNTIKIDYSGCYYIVYADELSTITIITKTASSTINLQTILSNIKEAFASVCLTAWSMWESIYVQPVIKYGDEFSEDGDYSFGISTQGWSWLIGYGDHHCCVAGDTFISTGLNGEYELAENIQVGDMVLTKDMETGELVLNKVTKVIRVMRPDVATIKLKNGKVLRISVDHPMYTTRGWVCVDHTNSRYDISPDKLEEVDLQVGDVVITNDGEVEIVAIDATGYSESIAVYNFEIENIHNFFAESVLVHNATCYS